MANMYVLHSRLSDEEIQAIVLKIIAFLTYEEISESTGRSIQSLRPLLNRIERRMYFEMDEWPLFHMMQFSNFNPNKLQRPYNNHIAYVLECIHRIPRAKKPSGMVIDGEKIDFPDEVACLFDCPQHLPPKQFVKKYGKASPIAGFKTYKEQKECADRIRLKRSCGACTSKLIDIWTAEKTLHVFRFAMEYAAKFGKPRKQNYDLFIARMCYYLIWRAFELNMDEYLSFSGMRHHRDVRHIGRDQAKKYYDEKMAEDKMKAAQDRKSVV